jgi:flagellar biosynthesis/type III secretory pathway protein FliH
VILRELKTDPDYILRVIQTMVKDIQTRDHLRILISQEDYSRIEELRAELIQSFSDLKNLRIEVDSTLRSGESKIETDQLLFDSTRAAQSAAIFEKLMSEFSNELRN